MTISRVFAPALAALAVITPCPAHAQADTQAQARDAIAQFADRLCGDVSLQGSETTVDISAKIEAQLKGLVSQVANLGASGAIDVKNTGYKGLPRDGLVAALRDNLACRTRVLELLVGPLLGGDSKVACSIEGRIFDKQTNSPLSHVEVRYVRRPGSGAMAMTGPDGRFTAQCRDIDPKSYPLRLSLGRREWGEMNLVIDETLREHEQRTGVNIYVDDTLFKLVEAKKQLKQSKRMSQLEVGWNIGGFNVAEYKTANAQDCSDLCRDDNRCLAMTFSTMSKGCWLHGVVGERARSSDLTSAQKLPP